MLRRVMIASPGEAVALTTWDSAYLSPLGVLSAGNRLLGANSTGQYANCRSVGAVDGLAYFSASCTKGGGNNWGFGLMDAGVAAGNSAWVGSGNSAGIWYEGRVYQGGATLHTGSLYPATAEVQIAIRAASRRYWMRVNAGAWIGGGDPVADTAPTGTLPGTGAIYIAGSIDSRGVANGTIRLPATSADITGAVPAGFLPGVQ